MGSNDSSGPACLGAKCLTVVAGVEMGGGGRGGGGYSFNPDKSLLRARFARFCNCNVVIKPHPLQTIDLILSFRSATICQRSKIFCYSINPRCIFRMHFHFWMLAN